MANSLILTKAQNAVTAHDWTTAARFYKELLRSDESNVEYLQQLGSIYVRGGQDDKAIPYYEQIITFNPRNTQAMVSLGGIFRRLKRYEDSVNILHKAQDIEADSPAINYNLGFTYKEMGDYEDAIDAFEIVISRNPDDVLAHNHLGSIYFAQKEYDKSIAAYKRGLQVDQNHPILNYNLAHVYEEMRNYPESVRSYEIALKTRPGWVEAIRDFSELLIKCQNTKQAQELVEQSIKLHPDDVELLCILGRIYLNQFDYDNATKTFKKAENLKQNDINILIGLSKSLEKGTKIDQAMEKILEAVDIEPENLDVCKQYAHVLLSAQRYEKALELIKKIDEKSGGKDLQTLDLYGQYFVCRGDEEAANTYFDKIKKINHHYKDYLINAADRYIQTGNYEKAQQLAESFVERRPQLPEGYNILGTVQVARGNLNKAKLEYEKGISLKNPNIYAVKELEKIYSELESNQELYNDEHMPVGLDADTLSKEEGGNLGDDDFSDSLLEDNDGSAGNDADEKLDALMESGLESNPPIEQALTGEDGDFWEDFDDDPDGKNDLIDEANDSENIYDENDEDSDLMSMMTPAAAETDDEESDGLLSDYMSAEDEPEKEASGETAAEPEMPAEPEMGSELGSELGSEPAATSEPLSQEESFDTPSVEPDASPVEEPAYSTEAPEMPEPAPAPEPMQPRPEPRYEPVPREYPRESWRDTMAAEETMQRLRDLERQQRHFAEEIKAENEKMIHEAVDEAVDKAVEEKFQEYDLPVAEQQQEVTAESENTAEPEIENTAEPEIVPETEEAAETEVAAESEIMADPENNADPENPTESEVPAEEEGEAEAESEAAKYQDEDLNLYDDEFTDVSFGDAMEETNIIENQDDVLEDSTADDELDASFTAGMEEQNETEEEKFSTVTDIVGESAETDASDELFLTVDELYALCNGEKEAEIQTENLQETQTELQQEFPSENQAEKTEEESFITTDDMLNKIERILNDDDIAKTYAAEIELFKKLRVLAGFMPEKDKNSFACCRVRMVIEYIISKMSGKPGLLITAESLIKSGVLGEEYNKQLEDSCEEELSNELIRHVITDMKKLAQGLEDKDLCNALCVSADGILEQIALRNQKSEIF